MPREFTEGTPTGVVLSIISAIVMGTLFVLEFRSYRRTSTVTDLVMDPGGSDGTGSANDFFIAFKVTMPELVRSHTPKPAVFPASPACLHTNSGPSAAVPGVSV